MPDPLHHDDLVAAKAALRAIIDDVVHTVSGHDMPVVVAALACAFMSACHAYDVEPVDVLEQVEDADATDDLPLGALRALTTA